MTRDLLAGRLGDATQARIGLGRAGNAVPTRPLLEFQLAHAMARDAVHTPLDTGKLADQLGERAWIAVESRADDRATFLKRPDLGRRLSHASAAKLETGAHDAVFVLADGLSATALHEHGVALLEMTERKLEGWSFAPPVFASQARVALGDEIGALTGAAMVVMLIGERPGLSSADSLGAYLTFAPQIGRRDAERNCISNIRPPAGQSYEDASDLLAWLMREAKKRGLSGVRLKDERARTPQIEGDARS